MPRPKIALSAEERAAKDACLKANKRERDREQKALKRAFARLTPMAAPEQ
jgi:hypothetical protein